MEDREEFLYKQIIKKQKQQIKQKKILNNWLKKELSGKGEWK